MLVIILVAILAFGCPIDAKKNLNLKIDRSDRLSNRNRRDAEDFYNQIDVASRIDDSCDQSSCATLSTPDLCKALCINNDNLDNDIFIAPAKCLSTVPCNLNEWKFSDVQMVLGVEGYDEACFLTGNQVTVSGGSDVTIETAYLFGYSEELYPVYDVLMTFTLTYSGLSIKCSNFTSTLTVTELYGVTFINSFFDYNYETTDCDVETSVELGSGVLDGYQEQVKASVQAQLKNNQDQVCKNYLYNMEIALDRTYFDACPFDKCKPAPVLAPDGTWTIQNSWKPK